MVNPDVFTLGFFNLFYRLKPNRIKAYYNYYIYIIKKTLKKIWWYGIFVLSLIYQLTFKTLKL